MLFPDFAFCAVIFVTDDDPSDGIVVGIRADLAATAIFQSAQARAGVISNQVVKLMNDAFPPSSTPATIYSVSVVVYYAGFQGATFSIVGDRNSSEQWSDILPEVVWQGMGVGDSFNAFLNQNYCGNNCVLTTSSGFDSIGAGVTITIYYYETSSCDSGGCTTTAHITNVSIFYSNGSMYNGPGLAAANDSIEDPGGL